MSYLGEVCRRPGAFRQFFLNRKDESRTRLELERFKTSGVIFTSKGNKLEVEDGLSAVIPVFYCEEAGSIPVALSADIAVILQ